MVQFVQKEPKYAKFQSFFPDLIWNLPLIILYEDVDVDVSKQNTKNKVHYLTFRTGSSQHTAQHGFHYSSLGFLQFYYNVQTMRLPVNMNTLWTMNELALACGHV